MSEHENEQVLCEDCGQQSAVCTVAVMMGEKVMHRKLCQACMAKASMAIAAGNLGQVLGSLMAAARNAAQNRGGDAPEAANAPSAPAPAVKPDVAQLLLPAIPGEAESCPQCGLTYEVFRKQRRPACAACCTAFRQSVRRLLSENSKSLQHVGRRPVAGEDAQRQRARLEKLQRQLEEAVAREDYEQAAILRDALRNEESRGNA